MYFFPWHIHLCLSTTILFTKSLRFQYLFIDMKVKSIDTLLKLTKSHSSSHDVYQIFFSANLNSIIHAYVNWVAIYLFIYVFYLWILYSNQPKACQKLSTFIWPFNQSVASSVLILYVSVSVLMYWFSLNAVCDYNMDVGVK